MSDSTELVAFSQESLARLLVVYLGDNGVPAKYDHEPNVEYPHRVILTDNSFVFDASYLTKQFVNDPLDPKYQDLAWKLEQKVVLTERAASVPKFSLFSLRTTPFMWSILATCVVVYILYHFGAQRWVDGHLKIIELSRLVDSAQWWRLFTPAFIHFDEYHIIFNLLWWWILGKEIEHRFGSSTLILIFCVSALVSNLGQLLLEGANFGGLSGVVYAVIGFVWWCGWLKPKWGLMLSNYIVGLSLIWLLLGYADLLWVSVANTAHTLGLVSGCLIAWCYVKCTDLAFKNRPEQ